jgi:hypothetical protein
LHHWGNALLGAKILQLFPDGGPVDARQVWSGDCGTEAFGSMTMVASASEEHAVEGVAAGSTGNGLTGPRDIGWDSGKRLGAGLPEKRSRTQHKWEQERQN